MPHNVLAGFSLWWMLAFMLQERPVLLRSVPEIVKTLGADKMEVSLGLRPGVASEWATRGAIPTGFHYRVHVYASSRGYTIDPNLFGADCIGLPVPSRHKQSV